MAPYPYPVDTVGNIIEESSSGIRGGERIVPIGVELTFGKRDYAGELFLRITVPLAAFGPPVQTLNDGPRRRQDIEGPNAAADVEGVVLGYVPRGEQPPTGEFPDGALSGLEVRHRDAVPLRVDADVRVALPRFLPAPTVHGFERLGRELVADHGGPVEEGERGPSRFGPVQAPVQRDLHLGRAFEPVRPRFGVLQTQEVRPGRLEMAVSLFSTMEQEVEGVMESFREGGEHRRRRSD